MKQDTVFIVKGNSRRAVKLAGKPLSQGGVGAVFKTPDVPGALIKIYHRSSAISQFERPKIQAMINKPPTPLSIRHDKREFPIFAWPSHIIEDHKQEGIGFAMPEAGNAVRLSAFLMRSELDIQNISANDRSLPTRIQIARNLASAIASLHKQQHYIIDMKPENIMVFRDTGLVCIIDCDGMCISSSTRRYAATAFTPGYLMPEVMRNNQDPRGLQTDHQDRFSLAVILFQLCQQHNGVHPYQGKLQIPVSDNSIDYNVKEGLYAYGLAPDRRIMPSPMSTHDCWEKSTLELFDRAFSAQRPSKRPSAAEWRDHFDSLTHIGYQRCQKLPDEVTHIHFKEKACPECRITGGGAAPANPAARPLPQAPQPSTIPPRAIQPVQSKSSTLSSIGKLLSGIALLVTIAIAFIALTQKGCSKHEEPASIYSTPEQESSSPLPALDDSNKASPPTKTTGSALESKFESIADPMQSADDQAGLQARQGLLTEKVIPEIAEHTLGNLQTVLDLASRDNDTATLEATRTPGPARYDPGRHFGNWTRFRRPARALADKWRSDFRSNPDLAIKESYQALAYDPLDQEVSANLAIFLNYANRPQEALQLSIYVLALSRGNGGVSGGKGSINQWDVLATSLALQDKTDAASNAWLVTLAITSNLSGRCQTMLSMPSDFGEKLKQPITAVFRRIEERGLSGTQNCAFPPAWINPAAASAAQ